jgi:hypothetical protein
MGLRLSLVKEFVHRGGPKPPIGIRQWREVA